jgi:hypothetical protein
MTRQTGLKNIDVEAVAQTIEADAEGFAKK